MESNISKAECMIWGSSDSMVLMPKISDSSGSYKFKMAAVKSETVYLRARRQFLRRRPTRVIARALPRKITDRLGFDVRCRQVQLTRSVRVRRNNYISTFERWRRNGSVMLRVFAYTCWYTHNQCLRHVISLLAKSTNGIVDCSKFISLATQ